MQSISELGFRILRKEFQASFINPKSHITFTTLRTIRPRNGGLRRAHGSDREAAYRNTPLPIILSDLRILGHVCRSQGSMCRRACQSHTSFRGDMIAGTRHMRATERIYLPRQIITSPEARNVATDVSAAGQVCLSASTSAAGMSLEIMYTARPCRPHAASKSGGSSNSIWS